MFTVSGIGVIPKDDQVVERQNNYGSYFNFTLVSKDPYKKQRHYLKVSVQVPSENTEEAREALQPGKGIQVRIGELVGRKLDSGFIAMDVTTKWRWIEPIKALPIPGKKKDA